VRVLRLSAFAQHKAGQHYEDVYYLPNASFLPVLSLGFRQALADLIWCKSLIYFGEELSHRGHVEYVFAYTDAVLALDPSYRSAYIWIATAAIYRPVAVSMDNGLRAARYLERATQRWPDDGELQWDYGSVLRFELAPLERDRAKKRALLERAAPHLAAAARLGAGPPWLALNNAELLSKLGRTEQAIHQLEELHGIVQDDATKHEIEQKLHHLRAETYLQAAQVAEQDFEQARVRSYPYLSPSLFMLVGERSRPGSYERLVADRFAVDDAAGGESGAQTQASH
jgi:tetratricopeptide (TPR) repeat protein